MLQRSEIKRSTTPLKRTAFKRPDLAKMKAGAKVGGALMKRAALESSSKLVGKQKQSVDTKGDPHESRVYSSFKSEPAVGKHRSKENLKGATAAIDKPRAKLSSRSKTTPKCERDHMGRVAELGCVLCRHLRLGNTPAIVHHLRSGQGKMRAPNWLTLPLCPGHHQHSGYGVHDMGRRQFYERYGISEIGLLQVTLELLRVDLQDPRFALPPDALSADLNDEPDHEDGHD